MTGKSRSTRVWMIILIVVFVSVPLRLENHSMIAHAVDHVAERQLSDELLEKELRFQQLQLEKLYEAIGLNDLDADATLEEKLDVIVEDERLDRTITSIHVADASMGKELYEQYTDFPLRPASNMKILTTIAALEVLESDYTYTTELFTDASSDGGTLKGNIYVKGGGDPTLNQEDFVQFAKDLKERGIEKIGGNLIGDDTRYDDMYFSQDVPWEDEQYYYGAPISALTVSPDADYDVSTIMIEVEPGEAVGEKAQYSVYPTNDAITIVNETETVETHEEQTVEIEREHGTNNIVLTGDFPKDAPLMREWRSVNDPTMYAMNVFKHTLEEEGISISTGSEIKKGETPEETELLSTIQSEQIDELLKVFMKFSNNGIGNLLVKEMGKVVADEGSTEAGIDVIYDVLSDYGAETKSMVLRDGSGLSDKTLFSTEQLSTILYEVQDASWYEQFEETLPVAGVDDRLEGGTLRYRMLSDETAGNIQAKTGGMTGVSTISGYVTTSSGDQFIFTIFMNNFTGGPMTQMQDVILTVLAEE